jgi:hypothetical protein
MKYCKNCGQNVSPTKNFSFGWFIVNCLWLVGGIVYIFYFLFMKKKVCPICGAANFEQKHSAEEIQTNKAGFPQIVPLSKVDRMNENSIIALEKAQDRAVIAKAKYARVKEKRIEDNRIWRIKSAEKKAAKAAKKAAKLAS